MHSKILNDDHYHFIGIGGIGMSAIAMALVKLGYTVSGSDLHLNNQTKKLKDFGVIIFDQQVEQNIRLIISLNKEKNIKIIVSSAIRTDNKELLYCIDKKLSLFHRSEILSLIMKSYISIGVAGSHGKTSTSTFLSTLLHLCTSNASSITGGIIPIFKSNAYIEKNKYLVAEIDESDGSTKAYKPDIGIITNIDLDHVDYYKNIEHLISVFKDFASNTQKLLTNKDCKNSQLDNLSHKNFSIKDIKEVNYSLIPKIVNHSFTIADYYEEEVFIESLKIPIPGLHNLSNIIAAIGCCRIEKIDIKEIKSNLKYLELPNKRFQFRGELLGRKFFDDYAHHPEEVKATINLAKLIVNNEDPNNKNYKRRVVAIFQPHRYSRLLKFIDNLAIELSKADYIIITDIYSAGEANINNLNSSLLVDKIYKKNKNIVLLNNNYDIKMNFLKLTKTNDFIINMGAGDCHELWPLLNKL